MADVRSFKELQEAIQKKTEKALLTDVKIYTMKKVNTAIRDEVYEAYTPTQYDRMYGLYDFKNIVSDVDGDITNGIQMSVEHSAKTSGGLNLSRLIILGQYGAMKYSSGIALYDPDWIKLREQNTKNPITYDETPYWYSRDFITSAIYEMNHSEIVEEFKKGMK